MNRQFSKSFIQMFLLSFLLACEDGLDDRLIPKTSGDVAQLEELSAGLSTTFMASSKAYDQPASWVEGSLLTRFTAGDALYDDARTGNSDPITGGLGPVHAGYSCGACHKNAGRTTPTLHTLGGSGAANFSSMLVYISRKNGAYFRDYGRVLHDQSIYGVEPEGKLSVTYTEETHQFPDGDTYSLLTPHYRITEWYADSICPEDLNITVRIPLRHVGMGQMMSLDLDELKKLAEQSNYPQYGISGRLNYITERGVRQIGVSGNKAQHADLTIELGFSSDLGVTNDRYPFEVCYGQVQMMGMAMNGIQITTRNMEDVDLYLHSLGVPYRRNVNNETVQQGEALFYEAKCHLCHTPTLHTRQRGAVLLNGTKLPWLGGQTIHPYSDYLLHDMGPGLDDQYVSGLAQGCEWRTTPLWGIGLQEKVNGHTYFLHDGRARNLTEAIMWHDGEGAVSREHFARMTREEREAVIQFLNSL